VKGKGDEFHPLKRTLPKWKKGKIVSTQGRKKGRQLLFLETFNEEVGLLSFFCQEKFLSFLRGKGVSLILPKKRRSLKKGKKKKKGGGFSSPQGRETGVFPPGLQGKGGGGEENILFSSNFFRKKKNGSGGGGDLHSEVCTLSSVVGKKKGRIRSSTLVDEIPERWGKKKKGRGPRPGAGAKKGRGGGNFQASRFESRRYGRKHVCPFGPKDSSRRSFRR